MNLLEDIFKTKPHFVNEEGVKWWVDQHSTEQAKEVAKAMILCVEELLKKKGSI